MWSLASLVLAFCLCASSQIVDIQEWTWIQGRYEDLEYTPLMYLEMKEVSRFAVVASYTFDIFNRDEDWFVGFSQNNDRETHNFDSHLVKWDGEENSFSDVGPQPRQSGAGLEETFSSINYFSTADGNTWAFHAFIHADNITEINPDPVTNRGWSYLYRFDENSDNFEGTPAFSLWSVEASVHSYYFTTPDNREFLWTANVATPYTRQGTPNCTILEYSGESWGISNLRFNCTKVPFKPLVFTGLDGNWYYLDTAAASVTFGPTGVQSTLTTTGVPQVFYTYRNNDIYYADAMQGMTFDNVQKVKHFQTAEWDYIVYLTGKGFGTYRLHWRTHRVEALPFVTDGRPPVHMEMFEAWGDLPTCLSISLGPYPGLPEAAPSVQDTYFVIYCWDEAHDRWNLVLKVPSFGVMKTKTFVDTTEEDDRLFLVALENQKHVPGHSVRVHEITKWYEDETKIHREPMIDSVAMAEMVNEIHEVLDDLYHYKAMIIAGLVLVALIFLLQLLSLLKGMSGGGGGGGGDYQSFS